MKYDQRIMVKIGIEGAQIRLQAFEADQNVEDIQHHDRTAILTPHVFAQMNRIRTQIGVGYILICRRRHSGWHVAHQKSRHRTARH